MLKILVFAKSEEGYGFGHEAFQQVLASKRKWQLSEGGGYLKFL